MKAMDSATRAVVGTLLVILGGCASQPRHFIDPSNRSPPGGREAVVLVPQGEIRAMVVASQAGAAFGLVGALVDVGVNQHRANAAESSITPLRTALDDYHFDERALDESKTTFTKMDWLNVRKTSFSKDPSKDNSNAILDKSEAPEVLMAVYSYELSADFAQMQVDARFSIVPKIAPKGLSPDARIKPENAVYSQSFTYIIALDGAGTDVRENCRKWSSNGAFLARRALDAGITQVNVLAQQSLAQTSSDVQKAHDGADVEARGRKGKLIQKTDSGTLLLDAAGSWVYVAQAPAG